MYNELYHQVYAYRLGRLPILYIITLMTFVFKNEIIGTQLIVILRFILLRVTEGLYHSEVRHDVDHNIFYIRFSSHNGDEQ